MIDCIPRCRKHLHNRCRVTDKAVFTTFFSQARGFTMVPTVEPFLIIIFRNSQFIDTETIRGSIGQKVPTSTMTKSLP